MKIAIAAAFTILLATTFAHPSFAQRNQDQYDYDQSSDQHEYGPSMHGQDRNWRQDRSWRGNDESSSGSNWHRHAMERMWEHHMQNEAARFRLRRGDSLIDVRCPVNETLQVCVNAASQLLDKVGRIPNVTSPTGASRPSLTPTPPPSVTAPETTTPTR
jgi:hypothetical protein